MARDFDALLVDYGGVLTEPLPATLDAFCVAEDLDAEQFSSVMRAMVRHEIPQLEIGAMTAEAFELALAARLTTRAGATVPGAGLMHRMFRGFGGNEPMVAALHTLRANGVRTALLSNSWGNTYVRDGWPEMFDQVVISGEVGLRKPDAAIYHHAADVLGVPAQRCVFIDDLAVNVRGAVAVGMCGIHHTDTAATLAELAVAFQVAL